MWDVDFLDFVYFFVGDRILNKFFSCLMDLCFDYLCCDNVEEFLIYLYDILDFQMWYFKDVLERSFYYIVDLEKVCLYFVIVDRRVEKIFFLFILLYWNYGFNYVIVFILDFWVQRKVIFVEMIEMVFIMIFIVYYVFYCVGFDISVVFFQKRFYLDV